MKFSIITFPGSNCDMDCIHAIKDVIKETAVSVFHTEEALPEKTDCAIIPGGFSYGDYLRSGAIARFSKITSSLVDFANKGGLIIGICNGFQILCEMGLLEGALSRNKGLNFICDEVYLKVVNNKTPFTRNYSKDEVIKLPIAHGDGCYINKNIDKNQIAFQYCDKNGNASTENNPNGSILNIAGITNKKGNVLGMMPHPERAMENILGCEDGLKLFKSIVGSAIKV